MKTTLIISLLCLSAIGGYAQNDDANTNQSTDRQAIKERAEAIYQRTDGNMGHGTTMHYKSDYSNVHAAYPDAPKNAVPAWPASSTQYTATQNPPCYKYKNNRGHEVMECPGAKFSPNDNDAATNETSARLDLQNDNLNVTREHSFTGNYPDLHAIYPQAPANAQAAYPDGEYKELQNPPCYKYVNKRGLKVMECPGAQFEPEHKYR